MLAPPAETQARRWPGGQQRLKKSPISKFLHKIYHFVDVGHLFSFKKSPTLGRPNEIDLQATSSPHRDFCSGTGQAPEECDVPDSVLRPGWKSTPTRGNVGCSTELALGAERELTRSGQTSGMSSRSSKPRSWLTSGIMAMILPSLPHIRHSLAPLSTQICTPGPEFSHYLTLPCVGFLGRS